CARPAKRRRALGNDNGAGDGGIGEVEACQTLARQCRRADGEEQKRAADHRASSCEDLERGPLKGPHRITQDECRTTSAYCCAVSLPRDAMDALMASRTRDAQTPSRFGVICMRSAMRRRWSLGTSWHAR